MDLPPPMLPEPPVLSDQAAYEMLNFLCELVTAFEDYYGHQVRRHQCPHVPPEPDLFDYLDDDTPPF